MKLNPQRKGGENSVYRSSIPRFLGYFACSGLESTLKMEMKHEVGIFGWALFGPHAKVIRHGEACWTVRTKGLDSFKGSVTCWFRCGGLTTPGGQVHQNGSSNCQLTISDLSTRIPA